VLHAEDEHRHQRRLLVAGRKRRDGEPCRELALQALRAPQPPGGTDEVLERPGDAAQVGGRAQDEAVVLQQAISVADQVFGLDQVDFYGRSAACAVGNAAGDVLGVSVGTVIDDGKLVHGDNRSGLGIESTRDQAANRDKAAALR
jgi:hypothetical protein